MRPNGAKFLIAMCRNGASPVGCSARAAATVVRVTDSSRRPVIVTGGAGFIGSHIVDRFHAAGERVIVLDDLSTGSPANIPPDVELIEIDLSARHARETIAKLAPALIVHAAAQASVARSTEDPIRDAEVNILSSLNVLCAACDASTGRFVYLNTGGALYGTAATIPTTEDETIQPLSPYGLSKRTAEEYLRLLAPRDTIAVSLRLANVYGPASRPRAKLGSWRSSPSGCWPAGRSRSTATACRPATSCTWTTWHRRCWPPLAPSRVRL